MTSYFALSQTDQRDVLNAGALQTGSRPEILEKDIWVCWALQEAFSAPLQCRMAFKGGTSLSKGYGIIQRFSEDVDLTLDYRDLNLGKDPLEPSLSATARKKIGILAQEKLSTEVHERLLPHITESASLTAEVLHAPIRIEMPTDDTIVIGYPAAVTGYTSYLSSEVRLEFGGRNITEPSETLHIETELAAIYPQIGFPACDLTALSAERTFWEKATLIHAACRQWQRLQPPSGFRLSRHWYDLAMLADSTVGNRALKRLDLLRSVVTIKQALFYTEAAAYPDCLTGHFCLLPVADQHAELARDYTEMLQEGLLPEGAPNFGSITARLAEIETAINEATEKRSP